VRLAAWREPGKDLILRRRAPASMMTAGFLASPLLAHTEDVSALFTGGPVARFGAYSVELIPGEEKFWEADLKFRIFQIENELGPRKGTDGILGSGNASGREL